MQHVVTESEAAAKQFAFTPPPANPNQMVAFLPSAIPLLPPNDYQILEGGIFDWNGKSLAVEPGSLLEGMTIDLFYIS